MCWFTLANVTHTYDNENIISSIPVVSPSTVTEYTDIVHLNVEHNPSSFAVVPVVVRIAIWCRSSAPRPLFKNYDCTWWTCYLHHSKWSRISCSWVKTEDLFIPLKSPISLCGTKPSSRIGITIPSTWSSHVVTFTFHSNQMISL